MTFENGTLSSAAKNTSNQFDQPIVTTEERTTFDHEKSKSSIGSIIPNLNIGGRLYTGFAIVGVILGFLVATTIWQVSNVSETLRDWH